MKTWREFFEAWTNKPLCVRSTGDEKCEDHFRSIATHISTILKLCDKDLVVDIGCDSGLVTDRVAAKVKAIVGVDFIREFVGDALKLRSSNNSHYFEADATALPFEAGSFDKGYCYNVIHNLPNKECGVRAIAELIRVCKPQSTILIGDVPDLGKRRRYLWMKCRVVFAKGSLKEKAKGIIRLILPTSLLSFVKGRILKIRPKDETGPELIWYDLSELKEIIEKQGVVCTVCSQKRGLHDYYYRSNLIIEKSENNHINERNEI